MNNEQEPLILKPEGFKRFYPRGEENTPYSLYLSEEGLRDGFNLDPKKIDYLRVVLSGVQHSAVKTLGIDLSEAQSRLKLYTISEALKLPKPRAKHKILPRLIRSGLVQSVENGKSPVQSLLLDPNQPLIHINIDYFTIAVRFDISYTNAINLACGLHGRNYKEMSNKLHTTVGSLKSEFSNAIYPKGIDLDNGLALCLALGIATISYPSK